MLLPKKKGKKVRRMGPLLLVLGHAPGPLALGARIACVLAVWDMICWTQVRCMCPVSKGCAWPSGSVCHACHGSCAAVAVGCARKLQKE